MGANCYVCRSYRGKTGRERTLCLPSWIDLRAGSRNKEGKWMLRAGYGDRQKLFFASFFNKYWHT